MPITADMRRSREASGAPVPVQPARVMTAIASIQTKKQKKRAAGYARVSSLLDSQEGSLDAQTVHLESWIRSNPDYEYAGVYIENGKSATHADNRSELQRLLRDCQRGKIDTVICKSLSRLARDAADCLTIIRMLKDLHVNVILEKESIDTGTMDGEFLLTIMAGLAADESRSIRCNTRMGYKMRMQQGIYKYKRPPYGYDAIDGALVINGAEAAIVRQIFDEARSGKGTRLIAAKLNAARVPTKYGKIWQQGTVRAIIRNITYTGDVLLQKTVCDDTFKRRLNKGQADQYYVENHHQAIIPHDVFEQANDALASRAAAYGKIGQVPVRNHFSGHLVCGICGAPLHRNVRNRGFVWVCSKHVERMCPMKPVWEWDIENAIATAFCALAADIRQAATEGQPSVLDQHMAAVGLGDGDQHAARSIGEKADRLKEQLRKTLKAQAALAETRAQGVVTNVEYIRQMNRLKAEESDCRDRLDRAQADDQELSALHSYLKKLPSTAGFDANAFIAHIRMVAVKACDSVEILFTCGLVWKGKLIESGRKPQKTKGSSAQADL